MYHPFQYDVDVRISFQILLGIPIYFVLPDSHSYALCRGYGKPSDKDSGSEDDDMSEEEGDTLASNTRYLVYILVYLICTVYI